MYVSYKSMCVYIYIYIYNYIYIYYIYNLLLYIYIWNQLTFAWSCVERQVKYINFGELNVLYKLQIMYIL